MSVSWFPGHMNITIEMLKTKLKIFDIVFELIDARIPVSSKDPEIDNIIGEKPRLILLNKTDLSSNNGNRKWIEYLNEKYKKAIAISAIDKGNVKKVNNAINQTISNYKSPIKAMIIGMPNVGKSTLINNLSGRKGTKTGNKPGITKNVQWIKIKNKFMLLDTPGLLYPSSGDQIKSENLSYIGAIKDEILDVVSIALNLLRILISVVPYRLEKRYKINLKNDSPLEVLTEIAIKRGCFTKNSEADYTRAANIVLKEFRKGIIGKVTLEYPG